MVNVNVAKGIDLSVFYDCVVFATTLGNNIKESSGKFLNVSQVFDCFKLTTPSNKNQKNIFVDFRTHFWEKALSNVDK